MSEGVTYSSKLQCVFSGWRLLADGEIALDMPEGNCCDMGGAVEIAQKVMPSVWRIATFSGGKADTEYRLSLGKWSAHDMQPNAGINAHEVSR